MKVIYGRKFIQTYDVEKKSTAGCMVVGAGPRDGTSWYCGTVELG